MMRAAVAFLVLVVGWYSTGLADDAREQSAFAAQIAPFLKTHCVDCHSGDEPEGQLDLGRYRDSARLAQDYTVWQRVLRMLSERQMPPADMPQPTEEERRAALLAIEADVDRFFCDGQPHPGRVTIRRLNRAEYNNTIRDLVGIDFQPAKDFPSDDVGHGFDNIGDVLSISPILLEKYLAAAETIVAGAFADEAARSRILAVEPNDDVSRGEAARRNLTAFVGRTFRRPARQDELERLFDLMRELGERGLSREEAFQATLVAVLTSPRFLFRVERDPPPDDEDGIRELDDYELATRLSYFLWSSMPDGELFALAERGELHQPEVLAAQARRMLADPKSQALVKNFAGQWLQLRSLPLMSPDRERFPEFDNALRTAMRRETELFFETVVREDRSVLEFLGADFTHVNARLARHYGIEGVEGDEFQQVKLPAERRGVLTHASVLLLTSNPTRTSPVKRGKWILDNILGEPPPPPPAGVEALDETAEELGTLRERMEQHRSNESCAVCHRTMDVLGFGLENFDVDGAWRDKDGRFEIDPSGTLPGGQAFQRPDELIQILAQDKRDAFCRCLTEKMLTYAVGRGLGPWDRCAVQTIAGRLESNDFRFSALVSGIVLSEPFRLREGPGNIQ